MVGLGAEAGGYLLYLTAAKGVVLPTPHGGLALLLCLWGVDPAQGLWEWFLRESEGNRDMAQEPGGDLVGHSCISREG